MAPPSHWRSRSLNEKARSSHVLRSFRRNPDAFFKLASAAIIIGFYLLYTTLYPYQPLPRSRKASIQRQEWFGTNVTRSQDERAERIKQVMTELFWNYRSRAWGYDAIKPVSGGWESERNGWGSFAVESGTTLAVMGLWKELSLVVGYVVEEVDFEKAEGLVDPYETTIRELGGMVGMVKLLDEGWVPEDVVGKEQRDGVVEQVKRLGDKLAFAYRSPTGLPWPRVDFGENAGKPEPREGWKASSAKPRYDSPASGPARAGSSILENCLVSDLTGNHSYFALSQQAWSPFVWNKYIETMPGLVDGPLDVVTGAPLAHAKGWDYGDNSYYEYLLKMAILSPHDRYAKKYEERWLEAASAIRHNLSSRSTPTDNEKAVHLLIGEVYEDGTFLNEMSHAACSAPGNLIYGGAHFNISSLITLGQALLETCHHLYDSTPTGLAPEAVNWISSTPRQKSHFKPQSTRQESELKDHGFFVADAQYKLRSEYFESLFYAWRVTGEARYREWAWDAFMAIENHCRTPYGYAMVADVMAQPGSVRLVDHSEGWFAAKTLKYLFLIFEDVDVGSLEEWLYTQGGHPLKMRM